MKFVFTDKKINVPNAIHAYAEKKVGKLDRFFKECRCVVGIPKPSLKQSILWRTAITSIA